MDYLLLVKIMNCYDILGKETKCWDNLGNSFWIDTEDLKKRLKLKKLEKLRKKSILKNLLN